MRMSSGSPGTGQAPTGTCRISSTAARYLTYKRPMPIDGFQAICPPIVKYMLTAVASLRRLPTAILTQASVSASPAVLDGWRLLSDHQMWHADGVVLRVASPGSADERAS